MPEWKILSKTEKDGILSIIEDQWGARPKFDYEMLLTPRNKIYIVKTEVLDADLNELRIDRLGIYFGELMGHTLRLSIEGSQIVGPVATQNVVETADIKIWLNGNELNVDEDLFGFQIVKSDKGDFMGCGKAASGRLLNYVPKTRRIGTAN